MPIDYPADATPERKPGDFRRYPKTGSDAHPINTQENPQHE